jgi:Putative zinc-finger
MNDPLCERLDDYLAHDLAGVGRDEFVAHLAGCAKCRASVDGVESLSSRLRTACERLDPIPAELAANISERIDARRWRRRALAAIALAASIGFMAFWLSRDGETPAIGPKAISPPIASAAPPVRVTFPNKKLIAVPVESESPNVTVLLVYPNLRTQPPESTERNER